MSLAMMVHLIDKEDVAVRVEEARTPDREPLYRMFKPSLSPAARV